MKKYLGRALAIAMAGTLVVGVSAVGLVAPGPASAAEPAATASAAANQGIEIPDGIYRVTAKMNDPAGLGMIHIADDSALLVVKGGKTSLRFMMGGTGVDYLYPASSGSAAEAAGKAKWLKPTTVVANTDAGLLDKYYFTVPVRVSQTGENVVPLCAHGQRNKTWHGNRDITFMWKGTEKSAASSLKPAKVKVTNAKSSKKKTATLTLKKSTKNLTSYQVRYATNKKFKKAKSANAVAFDQDEFGEWSATGSITVKKLKGGKKYWFQVRAYNWVSDSYGSWSAKKSAKVR